MEKIIEHQKNAILEYATHKKFSEATAMLLIVQELWFSAGCDKEWYDVQTILKTVYLKSEKNAR